MTSHCTDARMQEVLGAYLLGACPNDEADAVRGHIATCDACAREASDLVVARDALLTVSADRPAPPELKDRVMAQIRADAELFAAAKGSHADLPPETARAARPASGALRGGWRRWLQSPASLAAVAGCSLALVAGGALLGSSLGEDGGVTPARTQLGSVDGAQAPGGRAKVVFDGAGTARLIVTGLPNPGRERVYQVWVRSGDDAPAPTRALFSVLEDGSGETIVPADLAGVDQILVTSEPEGGSPAPTRAPLVAVKV